MLTSSDLHLDLDVDNLAHWASLVEILHEYRFFVKPSPVAIRRRLLNNLREATEDTLKSLLGETNFALAVACRLTDVYFCGFSKDNLVSSFGKCPHVHVWPFHTHE